jgi:hypothetical protein
MTLPSYFLPRPPTTLDADTIASFERLYAESVRRGPVEPIDYTLSAPKWHFLSYLCERKGIVLHGSGDPDIAELVPRKATDVDVFGDREAVYGATDGIWPMFFAIVDRDRPVRSLVNSCARVIGAPALRGWYYFFSIEADDLPGTPWRAGTVYLLPGQTFERQPTKRYRGLDIEITQVASLAPVRPIAKLAVRPEDFPFLDQVRRHDPAVVRQRAHADPDGFPWLDE